ncbi:MAG TPA: transglycosylase domain-containing protein, partial [Actinomycetota bacterium]|nr:transglycosylase domain-containing protein [Actinomycetota bacterium]
GWMGVGDAHRPPRAAVRVRRLPTAPGRAWDRFIDAVSTRAAYRPWRFVAIVMVTTFLLLVGMLPVAFGARTALDFVHRRFLGSINTPLHIPPMAERSTILDSHGSVLQHVYLNFDRKLVPLSAYPRLTRRSVLAIEDHAFYQHGAVDIRSTVRALLADLAAGRIVQGGSTISQQLVKDTITGDARTLARKYHEALDAIRLEHTYPKRRILSMYMNEVYLGNGVYGFAAAARYYFAEQPGQLTLPQSALLAGMIESPTAYDPLVHPKAARGRRGAVLTSLLDLGWITRSRFQRAMATPVRLSAQGRASVHSGPTSFWTQYVIHSFLSDPAFGATPRDRRRALFQGGLRITTTLDPSMQREAERAIAQRMTGPGLPQSALVSIAPGSGAIRAMAVGNWPFSRHQYDLAVDPGGGRTAGSSFKAFTLAAALEQGISPNAVYNGDSPKTIPHCGGGDTWTLHNAEPGSGNYPLWLATADSVNVVFAQVIDQVGPAAVARVAHRMGITSPLDPVCSLTLGTSPVSPLQMGSAYATLANDGVHCMPYPIAMVQDRTGKTIYRARPQCQRAIPASVAEEETAMLENVIRMGTGTAANIGRPAAGKTGTGQDYQDAWFVGFVPQLATAVWVGYASAEVPMSDVPGYGHGFGATLAAPIWHDFMAAATGSVPARSFAPAPIPFGSSSSAPTSSPSIGASPTPSPSPSPSSPAPSPSPSSPTASPSP